MPPDPATAQPGRRSGFSRSWWWLTLLAVLAPSMALFVDESELVLVERFGKIRAVYDQPGQRGLHLKLPWPIESVRRFDRRQQLLSPAGREAFTRDRKNVTVEAYVCWRIADGSGNQLLDRPVVKFFQGLGSIEVAEARLSTRLQSILTEQIAKCELSQLLNATNSDARPPDGVSPLATVSEEIRRAIEHRPDETESLRDRLGIEILEVRIRRLNLPSGNMQAVFERMRSERQKIAERYRSSGIAESRMIRSQADRQAGELLARANADAVRIRGEGEAAAIHILNEAHAKDPEFAELLQTLDAYQQILNEKTTLVLSGSNSLLKLFMNGLPAQNNAPASIEPPDVARPAGDNKDITNARSAP